MVGSRRGQGRTKRCVWDDNANAEKQPAHTKTTLVVKNVPKNSRRDDLCELLDAHGFAGKYDFVYVPADFKTMSSFGYAFVNFAHSECAEQAILGFQGFEWQFGSCLCALNVAWSEPNQGLDMHVQRYRNCPVMHPSVADEFKPILLSAGTRVPFPAPTKSLSAPRDVRRKCDVTTQTVHRRRRAGGGKCSKVGFISAA